MIYEVDMVEIMLCPYIHTTVLNTLICSYFISDFGAGYIGLYICVAS